jgi:transcriptional regulator with XRE-family HTH domain/tetratricopeptide (TPR) repeat protein
MVRMGANRKDMTGQDRADDDQAPAMPVVPAVPAASVVFNHELLRSARLDLGVSQEEMARSLGVDVRTYRRYESGEVNSEKGFEVRRNASRRQLLRKMCDELGVADEEAWLVPMKQTVPAARTHALLRANHFVGRAEVLRALDEWVAESPPGIFAIVGVGGAGKTAVVERFLSASSSSSSSPPSLPWVHSFYDDARTEPVVHELAHHEGALVVLDGIESVQSTGTSGRAFGEIEDAALRRVLRAVCSGVVRRKVIVTSRFPLSDFAAWEGRGLVSHALAPLDHGESIALLRAWGMTGDDAALTKVADRSGGHALSVAMVGSYVGTFLGGNQAPPEIPDDAEGDDASTRRLAAVLDSYASALTERERDVIARLSIFAGAADVELLAEVCSMDESEVLKSVARLERLGLVAKTPQGITAHPFVRDRFKRRLLGVSEKDAHAQIGRAIGARLEGKPDAYVKEEELLDRYEELLVHTLRAGRELEAYGIYARALGGYANLGLRLGAMARGARVLEEFRGREPAEARASIYYDRGLYACALGDLEIAKRMHNMHIAAVSEGSSARAMGLRTRAYVAWVGGDLDVARATVRQSLEVALGIQETFHVIRAHSLEAIIAHDQGDEEGATKALAATHKLEERPTARRAYWEAEILTARGDREAARAIAERAVMECARRGWIGHVAHGNVVLGMVAKDKSEAAEHLERAKPWVMASNEVEMALRCELLSAARLDDVEAAKRGLMLAEAHGFKTFERRFRDLMMTTQQLSVRR